MAMMSIASTAGGEDSDGGVCAKLRALPPRDDAGLSGLDAPPSKARILSNPAASVGGGGGVAAAKRVDVSTDDVDEGAECLGGRLDLCGVRAEDDAPGESNPGDSPVGSLSRTNSSARSGHRRDRATQKLRPASVSIVGDPNRANAALATAASSTARAVSSSAEVSVSKAVPGVRRAATSVPGASASAARATTPQGRHARFPVTAPPVTASQAVSSAAVAPPTTSQVSYRPLRSL